MLGLSVFYNGPSEDLSLIRLRLDHLSNGYFGCVLANERVIFKCDTVSVLTPLASVKAASKINASVGILCTILSKDWYQTNVDLNTCLGGACGMISPCAFLLRALEGCTAFASTVVAL